MPVILRPVQEKVIKLIKKAVEEGKTDIFVQAPPGVGKSLISLEVSNEFNDAYILTSEKSLQQQYEDDCQGKWKSDHGDVKSLCGIDTYNCRINNAKFSLGVCKSMGMSNGEALKLPCADKCEYLQRWKEAKTASRTILNYNLAVLQFNYVLENLQAYAPFQKREVCICDEAHKLPEIIESHFACKIDLKVTERIDTVVSNLRAENRSCSFNSANLRSAIIRVLNLPLDSEAEVHIEHLKSVRDELLDVLKLVVADREIHANKFLTASGSVEKMKEASRKIPKEVRQLISLVDSVKDRHCKVEDYIEMLEAHGLDNLVADEDDGTRSYHNLSDIHLFHRHFAKYSDVRIYLSATLQPELLIKRWGLDCNHDRVAVINSSSGWDKRRSPIVLTNTANMSYKGGPDAVMKGIEKVDELLKEHHDVRGVIHTTTHDVTKQILSRSRFKGRLVAYADTLEKMDILSKWDTYPSDAVLIGPSLFTGIDLRDDFARFNIIFKLAFPSMKSALWAKRFKVSPHIYFGETAAVLEQSCGRTTRSKDDWSISYILDDRAAGFISRSPEYFSKGFLARVVS